MDKTIEKPFLRAFDFGGVVHNCIDYLRQKYDLGYLPQIENYKLNEKSQHFYDVQFPKIILEKTEAFDDSVILYNESPLMDEIERNLNECQTDIDRENYLFTLLKPFSEIAKVYCPVAEISRLKKEISSV
jgi:hypothetical protein